ncbi:MAG: hypothetical protein RBS84_02170 [Kiritimatiellia bacterium]|jgi:hypothetical protein|nr:hypothetical protein [Kiritimatiellia bacterium]
MLDEKIPGRGNLAESVRVRVIPGLAVVVRIVMSVGGGAAVRATVRVDFHLLSRRARGGKLRSGDPDVQARVRDLVMAVPGSRHVRAGNVAPVRKILYEMESGGGFRDVSRAHG